MNVDLRSRNLNIISLCTGGAGLDMGLELALPSARPVVYVERESFACGHLVSAIEKGLLAPAPIWTDAKSFRGRPWRGAVDGLIGGIPCQPHSTAGRKKGRQDPRDLWSSARRTIVQARPWFVCIENVSGMLSAGADEVAGADRVHRDLRKLGFSVEGGLFTASEVGATHQRERVFILAVADGNSEYDNWGGLGRTRGRFKPKNSGRRMADTISQGLERRPGSEVGDQLPAAERICEDLANTARLGQRREGDGSRAAELPVEAGSSVVDTSSLIGSDVIDRASESGQQIVSLDRAAGRDGDGGSAERDLRGRRADAEKAWLRPLFAPGPADLSRWGGILASAPEFEPAFRRVADGLAGRMDIGRVDRLRMLGNGVVPLEAAYAIRTLAARLAERGSAGAIELVRLMGFQ